MSNIPLPFSDKSVSDWIIQLQQSNSGEERLRALQAVGLHCRPEETVRWSAYALKDTDSSVKALAAKLDGNLRSGVSAETELQLVSLLTDEDPDVQFESARALIRQKSQHADQAVSVLISFLDEPETHPLMLAAVVNALAESEIDFQSVDDQIKPRLVKLIEQERAEVREAVANAFAKWPVMAKTCWEPLLPLLDDCEPIVREKIAATFGAAGINNEQIRVALQTASQDEDTEVARVASEALQRLI